MPLTAEFYRSRRRELMSLMGDGAAAVVAAGRERIRSNDVEYRFRSNSDFGYLTGFPEPDALCLLLPGHPDHEYVLFVRPRDQERETWTGRRSGIEGAVQVYGADAAHPVERASELIPDLLQDRESIYHSLARRSECDQQVLDWIEKLQVGRQRSGRGPTVQEDLRAVLHEMRLYKRPEEIEAMRHVAEISCNAHRKAMRRVAPGVREYEIEAELEYVFRSSGAAGPAYPSIVAGGENAAILHYTENCCTLEESDLILIDAGAEFDGYCGDVTRTFPVGKRFDGRHRALYEVVLAAQLAAIEKVVPGNVFDDAHEEATRVLVEGLIELGILDAGVNEAIEKALYTQFYMHRTSHWLGRDVHDVGGYREGDASRTLEPGMVLTVEPGLYLGAHTAAPPHWQGLGIRIEDDVVVTGDGCEVLTDRAPKRIDDIEALRRDAG